jgi:hypothetical protein
MAISAFLSAIKQPEEFSASAKVLSDPNSDDFKLAIQRWTNLNLQIPGAIVMVETEDDILKTVRPLVPSPMRSYLTVLGKPCSQERCPFCSQVGRA